MKISIEQLAEIIKENKGCRIVQLKYTSRRGEVALHTLALGVNILRAYRRDEKIVSKMRPKNEIAKIAKAEVLDSIRESLRLGIGNNSQYTCKGCYQQIATGIKLHIKNNELHICGFSIRKFVISKGEERPPVLSSMLTLAKKQINKKRKMSKFRQFVITNVISASMNGQRLELEADSNKI